MPMASVCIMYAKPGLQFLHDAVRPAMHLRADVSPLTDVRLVGASWI